MTRASEASPEDAEARGVGAGRFETWGVEVWRGGVNPWECDEMGHMNLRFYAARANEGLQAFTAALGLPDAFAPAATSTLRVREHHMRFQAEARAGAPLVMTAGVVEVGETEARLLMVLRHARDNRPCASFLTRVAHVTVTEARPFAWSRDTRALAAGATVTAPDFALPRGLDGAPVEPAASRARALELGLACIGRGVIQPAEADVFGRLRPDALVGRCGDGMSHLMPRVEDDVAGRIGRAVLELRQVYARPARVGAHFELFAGVADIGAKTDRIGLWMVDPASGEALASGLMVAGNLDLDTRRLRAPSPARRAALEKRLTPGLTL
jgi:acyl-CoA thioester hydrolase